MHPAVLAWIIVGGGVGMILGSGKGQTLNGGLAGLLLGPLGWVLILTVAKRAPKCSECKEWVRPGAKRCRHCGEKLRRSAR